ncbi:MAG: hypothetical protein ABR915_25750, partial [Thermoguttaceae bacterium]
RPVDRGDLRPVLATEAELSLDLVEGKGLRLPGSLIEKRHQLGVLPGTSDLLIELILVLHRAVPLWPVPIRTL